MNLAREHDVLPVVIVLNLPADLCHARNAGRADRSFGPHVVRQQSQQLRRHLRGLEREGFRYAYVLNSPEEVEQVEIERQQLWNNRKWDRGPFDVIGDVRGCFDELAQLLGRLGYAVNLLTGRHGIFNRYEPFIHIVDATFNQHAKWLNTTRCIPWRRPIASLNCLRSSGWPAATRSSAGSRAWRRSARSRSYAPRRPERSPATR